MLVPPLFQMAVSASSTIMWLEDSTDCSRVDRQHLPKKTLIALLLRGEFFAGHTEMRKRHTEMRKLVPFRGGIFRCRRGCSCTWWAKKSRMREEFGRGCRLPAPPKKVEHLPLGWDACQRWVYEETGRGGRVCLIGYSWQGTSSTCGLYPWFTAWFHPHESSHPVPHN